jgi:hypothetical protein
VRGELAETLLGIRSQTHKALGEIDIRQNVAACMDLALLEMINEFVSLLLAYCLTWTVLSI